MKAGFLLSHSEKPKGKKSTTNSSSFSSSSELGPLKDERTLNHRRVKFLWSGGADTISSKPASWGWNTVGNGNAPGWKPRSDAKTNPNNDKNDSLTVCEDAIMTDVRSSTKHTQKTNPTTFTGTATTTDPTPTPIPSDPQNPYKHTPILPHKTIGVPKNALSSWYGKRHKNLTLQNKYFTTWHDGGVPHLLKWTCLFTCPVTGEKFASGRYGDEKLYTVDGIPENKEKTEEGEVAVEKEDNESNEVSMKDPDDLDPKIKKEDSMDSNMVDLTSDTTTTESNDTALKTGVVWYNKKIASEHAAAARALDCLNLREEMILQTGVHPLRLCVEEPYGATQDIHIKQIGNRLELHMQSLKKKISLSNSASEKRNEKKKRHLDGTEKYRNQYRNQRRSYSSTNNRHERFGYSSAPPPPPPPPPQFNPNSSYGYHPNTVGPPPPPPPPPPQQPYQQYPYNTHIPTNSSIHSFQQQYPHPSSNRPPPPPPPPRSQVHGQSYGNLLVPPEQRYQH